MFEQFNVPFKSIMDADIKAGALSSEVTTSSCCRPTQFQAMTGERPAAGAAPDWTRRRRRPPDRTPPVYRSGFGADGVKCAPGIRSEGGNTRDVRRGRGPAIQRFGLPVRNIVAGLPGKGVLVAGLDASRAYDNPHPLAYGMPAEGLALFIPGARPMK